MIGNLPNILTLARILLLPFFAASLIYEEYTLALSLFIAASITDLLDGFIARIKKQTTYFGSILDPVADKFFLITSFILMSIYGSLPAWLAIIVISKDIIVVTGCIIIYLVTHNLKIEPSIWGKAASTCQFALIGFILLLKNINSETQIDTMYFLLTAAITTVAGVHYVYKGLKQNT
ncbi:MAG: CDP-alcohol phosphatidyltransferase family protein [Nitrospirae bacterium]|nr:CDP-alcohol phosphatidyltransferase family protein [Nitrospirota bacterium]